MRLLHVHSRQVEDFIGAQVPRYAILSHTWGAEEVLLQDLADPEHRSKKGYAKIEGSCQQAIRDGFDYVWVDTCCIDKSSSAELSEAINSMFEWYKRGQICYVYLVDVPTGDDPYAENSPFRRSRWFTRGWTLQELIAPRNVVFFDTHWDPIFGPAGFHGDVLSQRRAYLLSEITGIDPWSLVGDDRHGKVPICLKLAWAAKRKTTRIEDMAYCMLGLLEINMPLLYGEGPKAFIRLQEEVLKSTQDLSVLAWGFDKPWQQTASLSRGQERSGNILAPSITYFESLNEDKCRPILRDMFINNPLSFKSHSMMTNHGLLITLPIICIEKKDGLYLAMIVGGKHSGGRFLGLPLRRIRHWFMEPLHGTPNVILQSLSNFSFRPKVKWKTVYLVGQRQSISTGINDGRMASSLSRSLLSLNTSWNTKSIPTVEPGIWINLKELAEVGFVVRSLYPPWNLEPRWDGSMINGITCNLFRGKLEMIMVLSRTDPQLGASKIESYALRIKLRAASDTRLVRSYQASLARASPFFDAWQYDFDLRHLHSQLFSSRRTLKLKWVDSISIEAKSGTKQSITTSWRSPADHLVLPPEILMECIVKLDSLGIKQPAGIQGNEDRGC